MKKLDKTMQDAIWDDNIEKIKDAVLKGANVNLDIMGWDGFETPLRYYAPNNYEMVQFFLEKGADPSLQSKGDGLTPLMAACQYGKIETVKILLKHGAKVNVKDFYQNSALSIAAEKGYDEIVVELINNGLDLNAKAALDNALIDASLNGHSAVVSVLIKNGANPSAKASRNVTALMLAAMEGHKETVKLLIENGASIKEKDIDGRTAISIAQRFGHDKIVKIIEDTQ